jgi:DNA-directed RNA polymerase specialized sigma24 family protein
MDVIDLAMDCLTEIQRRRYLRYLHGETLTYIAVIEGVSVSSVRESIKFAEKKLKKRLHTLKTP